MDHMKPASRFKRLIAWIIDTIILTIASNVINLLPGQWLTLILNIITSATYFIVLEQSKWQGTIGKKLFRLKVVDSTNNQLSPIKSFWRHLCYLAPVSVIHLLTYLIHPKCFNIQAYKAHLDLFDVMPCVWSLFIWPVIIHNLLLMPVFFTKDKTTVYDMVSKTKVVC
jgi:uncharacterized RDD family membrane protein YckC